MRTISYNLSAVFLARLTVGGLSLVMVGLLTRFLGPIGYGYYSLIFAYLFVFNSLADLGLQTILVKEISQNEAKESEIAGNILSLRLISVFSLVLVGGVLTQLLSFPPEVKRGFLIGVLFVIFSSVTQILVGVFQKHLRLYWVSFADVVSRLVQLIMVFLAIRSGLGLPGIVMVAVIAEGIRMGIVFLFARKLVKIKLALDVNYWSKVLRSSLPIAAALFFTLLYFKLDTIILAAFKPAGEVGVYSAAYKVLEVVIFLPAAFIGLVMPKLSQYASDLGGKFKEIFKSSFDVLAIFAFPAMAYLFVAAEGIVKIIGGESFSDSAVALKILSLAVLFIFFGNLGGSALIALNLQKKSMWIYFVGALFNVGANLVFIPRYGFIAASWSTVATEILVTGAMFWLIKKEAGAAGGGKILLKTTLAIFIIFPLLALGKFSLWQTSLLSLAYFPVLYFLGGFNPARIKEIL